MINDTKQLLIRLGNILTNTESNEITKELFESLKRINSTKENLLKRLIEQSNLLVQKKRFLHTDYDDLQYRGLSDIKPMFNYFVLEDYYEPELINSAFEKNYKRYPMNGDKIKELSLIDYLNMVRPNVNKLIIKKKTNEKKVQLVIPIVFLNFITNKLAKKVVNGDNIVIIPTDDSNEIIKELCNALLHRYQETLDNKMEGSSFVFEYVTFRY